MRGFEQCSSSYASGSRAMVKTFGRQRCLVRQPSKQRMQVIAAEAKDSQLVQSSQGGQSLTQFDSEHYAQQKITLREAHDGSWVDKVDDWWSFFEHPEYLAFEDPALDDTYDGLTTGSASNTNQIRKAQDAIVSDLLSSKWREEHPDAILWQPYPIEKHYDPDIPEPEPLPTNDWTDFELRAFVEKRHWKARKDAEWQQRQQDVGRYSVVNVTAENDVRLMPKWEPIKQWTHEEIWDMILNGGRNANPADVPIKTFDPTQKADYYAEGIKYVPETEEWLAEAGHLWEDVAEPDMSQELSMLASDFSDINVGGGVEDSDDQAGEAETEEDASNEPDESTELGKLFGPADL